MQHITHSIAQTITCHELALHRFLFHHAKNVSLTLGILSPLCQTHDQFHQNRPSLLLMTSVFLRFYNPHNMSL